MEYSLLDFFSHPALRVSTLASMLMGLSAALVGSIALVQKRSLLGEALSHAAYPGILLAPFLAVFFSFFLPFSLPLFLCICIGALFSTYLGLLAVHHLEQKWDFHPDIALSLASSLFLGLGILIASRVQFIYPLLHQQLESFLYGQIATMTTNHLFLYAAFACICLFLIIIIFRQIEILAFDRTFAANVIKRTSLLDQVILLLLLGTVVIGIRSVGIVLMSGMLIAPSIAARQLTNHFAKLLFLAAFFGVSSAFFGNVLAVKIPVWVNYSTVLPTGPLIVLVATGFCLASLLFAKERGVVSRLFRIAKFRFRCLKENILKTLWKQEAHCHAIAPSKIRGWQKVSRFSLWVAMMTLKNRGYIGKEKKGYILTSIGTQRAAALVRLHRLWELYLTSQFQMKEDCVHRSAEEMEHILTPDIEKKLTSILNNPLLDPHDQPIPKREEMLC